MRAILTLLLIGLCAQSGAATYRWVDDAGQVHYSDRPREGAVKVELRSAQSYQQPRAAESRKPVAQPAARPVSEAPVNPYASVRIVRPAPQETYRNIGGQLPVTLSLNPGLRGGHRVRVYYDGIELSSWPGDMLSHTLSDVYRGEHNLRAAVVDAQGREIASSETVTFFVHQTSIYNRARN